MTGPARAMLDQFLRALGASGPGTSVELVRGGSLPSVFAVSDLAQASVAAAGAACARLVALDGGAAPGVVVDRDLASAWFGFSIRPEGWELVGPWDALAGDYAAADGWIKLHTNAPHHRAAAVAVLGVPGDRQSVAGAVATWDADELEDAVVGAGGAAAGLRSAAAWDAHPQGRAVSTEPLVHRDTSSPTSGGPRSLIRPDRPLGGLRVLDLTRVLAGPVATRVLAGWGAQVLRIDPPGWDEPGVVPEVTLGKRCARLDLTTPGGRDRFLELLRSADVLVHGYRADALDGLGLGADMRADARPGLVDVSLDAYGWTGPWVTRRGFDSLVQMSSGIAASAMTAAGADRPVPLPVQALDHATGYLLAACALTGLAQRRADGTGSRWRTSLARMARLLVDAGTDAAGGGPGIDPAPPRTDGPLERTAWGDARRIPPPVQVDGAPLHWSLPAGHLGASPATWLPD